MAAVFTDSNFETEVLNADKLSVIDFWAPWCGPCLALGPTIETLSKEYDGKVNIGKVNVDENPQLSINYGITHSVFDLTMVGRALVKLITAPGHKDQTEELDCFRLPVL